ncbi:MAG: hypothetical protein GYA33_11625 [Thermogutta sp.]|nr:hypothetical protein [Thermogutta sp.]
MQPIRSRKSRRHSRRGMLSFEWVLLISLLVIGIIGGLAAVRNALLSELNDLAQAVEAINVCGTCDPSTCPPDDPNCCDNAWWIPPGP